MSSIRLDAIPLTGRPQVCKTETSSLPYTPRVNCVLHSGQLPAQQLLEVRVNGILQTGVAEGNQTVFAWQLFKATDEIHMTLLNRGTRIRQWQGCWNERDAILHTGTLHIHIVFDGKPQPMMETTTVVSSPAVLANVPSPLPETANGTNGYTGTVTFENDEETKEATFIVQDLLVIAEAKQILPFPPETETTSVDDQQAIDEDEDERYDEMDERDEDEDERYEREYEIYERDDDDDDECEADEEASDYPEGEERRDHFEGREDTAIEEERAASVVEDEQSSRREPILRTGRCIAAFHASSVAIEHTLQSLKDLVATLPPKTLIVDLRVQSQRQKKPYQEHHGLSKHLLRAVFGTKYWDRGWAIQTTEEHMPPAGQRKTTRWRFVVVNPDHHPEGIPSLVQRIEEGYSLVVMDSQATYEESRRQAVIEEVQKRISDLDVGPLS